MLSKSILPCIHKENRVKSSHIIKLQVTDTGYRNTPGERECQFVDYGAVASAR